MRRCPLIARISGCRSAPAVSRPIIYDCEDANYSIVIYLVKSDLSATSAAIMETGIPKEAGNLGDVAGSETSDSNGGGSDPETDSIHPDDEGLPFGSVEDIQEELEVAFKHQSRTNRHIQVLLMHYMQAQNRAVVESTRQALWEQRLEGAKLRHEVNQLRAQVSKLKERLVPSDVIVIDDSDEEPSTSFGMDLTGIKAARRSGEKPSTPGDEDDEEEMSV